MAYTPLKQHAPLDENVKVPAAIRAAALRADAIHKQAYETPDAPVAPEVVVPPAAEVVTPPASEAAPAPAPTPPPEGSEEDFKHKYNSLKGRYDRQESTIQQLTRQMEELRIAQQRQAPTQAPNPDLQFKDITAEERETYGEDFISVAGRAAAKEVAPFIKGLKDEIEQLKGNVRQVGEVTHRTTQQQMFEYLDGQQANWREINRDPKFLAWANLQNPYSGGIRVVEMRDAYDKGDAQRVLRFFKGFLSDEAAMAPAPSVQPDDPNKGKIPLAEFAAPGRAKAPAASVPPGEKETISQSQIANFYVLVQKGHYRGNDAEKDRLEKMIWAAQAEGRVTAN